MPARRLSPSQQQLVNRLRQLERALDNEFLRLGNDAAHTVRNYRNRALTDADRIPLLQRIDAVLDPVYGSTRPSVPRTSSLYRLIRQTADGTIEDVFRSEYGRLRGIVQPVNPGLWDDLEAVLSIGGTGPDDELAQVYRFLFGPHVERERILRSKKLDVNRSWVPKDRHNRPGSYRLSDRIWKNKKIARDQIDQLIREAIRNGTDPLELAKQLEDMLLPDAQIKDITLPNGKIVRKNATYKPRGTLANYNTMRLARTEIQRVNAQATLDVASSLPSVQAVRWALSNSHEGERDECDDNAANHSAGMPAGEYLVEEFPLLPSHPNCTCTAINVLKPRSEVIDELVSKYVGLAEAA